MNSNDTEMTAAPVTQPAMEEAANPPKTEWKDLGLSPEILELVAKAGYAYPTPVQAGAIPPTLEGRDVIGSAQTGTGKTASFVLPMVERFRGREGTFGLILCPTREIAQQTQQTLEIFGTPLGLRSIVLIGGINMRLDAQALATYPQIIVATPGRLCDHLDRGNLWLDFIKIAVLDEADRMLDMGFAAQLSRITEELPLDRQTLLYSATFPPAVEHLARKILHDPVRVAIGKPMESAKNVNQELLWTSEDDKMRELRRLLRQEPGTVIIFTRSKIGATKVWRSLHSSGFYDATYLHSDCLQSHREQALADFKSGKYRILVATDVAGRGIHVDAVARVVNYDLPLEPEDYVHRIGRTGRQGASGRATTFVTGRDRRLLGAIERMLGKEIPDMPGHEGSAKPQQSHEKSSGGSHGHKSHGKPAHDGAHAKEHKEHKEHKEPRTHGHGEAHAKPAGSGAPAEGGAPKGDGSGKRRRRRRRGPRKPKAD